MYEAALRLLTTPRQESRKRKRGCDESQPSHASKRSITFEQVFRDGNAAIKHIIVRWPTTQDRWFIIRCEEHDLNFKLNPLVGGATHLRSRKHSGGPTDHNSVIEAIGIEVLGCNETLAAKNNSVVREAINHGYTHPSTEEAEWHPGRESEDDEEPARARQRNERISSRNGSLRNQDKNIIINPKCGDVYAAYWRKSKQWYGVVILPLGSFKPLDLSGSIEDLGLLNELPPCYVFHAETQSFGWAKGYEENGPNVTRREFPVMFFDGAVFPDSCSVGWIQARDLEVYDPNSRLIDYNQQVQAWLKHRTNRCKSQESLEARNVAAEPAEEMAVEEMEVEEVSVEEMAVEEVLVEEMAIEEVPVEEAPVAPGLEIIDLTVSNEGTY